MENVYITKVILEEVRNLTYAEIPLSTKEKKNLIITGKNGSGKTTILTLKIMKLLNNEIKEPQGLACLTFSREAAREFEERLIKLGYGKRRNVFLGTVHSFCISEIIANFAELYDYGISLPIKVLPKKIETQYMKRCSKT